jgi:hypothetical protein
MTLSAAREILEVAHGFRQMLAALDHHPEPSPIRNKVLNDLRAQHGLLTAAGGPEAVAEALAILTSKIPDA